MSPDWSTLGANAGSLFFIEPPPIREGRHIHIVGHTRSAELVPIHDASISKNLQRELIKVPQQDPVERAHCNEETIGVRCTQGRIYQRIDSRVVDSRRVPIGS